MSTTRASVMEDGEGDGEEDGSDEEGGGRVEGGRWPGRREEEEAEETAMPEDLEGAGGESGMEWVRSERGRAFVEGMRVTTGTCSASRTD
eukprot:753858-Hanusia_phi.AAC.10